MKTFSHNSYTFKYRELNADAAETIVLLHGFPASTNSWLAAGQELAQAGFRVLIPEQRGYTKGAMPPRRRDYQVSELVEDLSDFLAATNTAKAHIVGHDWGGVVAWVFADTYPQKTASLIAVTTPHPKALLKSLWRSRQLALSWYMIFFQLPFLPERFLKHDNGKRLYKTLTSSGLNKSMAAAYTQYMLQGKHLTCALNWYRALPFTAQKIRRLGTIHVPTLFLYGDQDAFLSTTATELTAGYVQGPYQCITLPGKSHWLPEEAPQIVAAAITHFIHDI